MGARWWLGVGMMLVTGCGAPAGPQGFAFEPAADGPADAGGDAQGAATADGGASSSTSASSSSSSSAGTTTTSSSSSSTTWSSAASTVPSTTTVTSTTTTSSSSSSTPSCVPTVTLYQTVCINGACAGTNGSLGEDPVGSSPTWGCSASCACVVGTSQCVCKAGYTCGVTTPAPGCH